MLLQREVEFVGMPKLATQYQIYTPYMGGLGYVIHEGCMDFNWNSPFYTDEIDALPQVLCPHRPI